MYWLAPTWSLQPCALYKACAVSMLLLGLVCRRSQIANAVEYQRMLQKFSSYSVDMPRARQLMAVALASGLPFVGFGFVDNMVMVSDCRQGGEQSVGQKRIWEARQPWPVSDDGVGYFV
jgi:hypothetical protein